MSVMCWLGVHKSLLWTGESLSGDGAEMSFGEVDGHCLFNVSDSDDSRGLFGAFTNDDDDAGNASSGTPFFFSGGFDTSVADTSTTSETGGSGGAFQFLFGGDANRSASNDDDNGFTLF